MPPEPIPEKSGVWQIRKHGQQQYSTANGQGQNKTSPIFVFFLQCFFFADIGALFGGFDFSQIAVGCYLPRWFMQQQHVNEEDAVQIHLDVKSKLSMGVHWGAFRLCDDAIDAPIDELPKARRKLGVADDAFVLFALGETRVLRRGLKP